MWDLFSCFCTTFLFPLSPPKEDKKLLSLWCSEINDVLLPAGVNLHHDVQNALSEDTGHCDPSQLWRGKLPFYTLESTKTLIVGDCSFILLQHVITLVMLSGPELLAALLAGHAAPHAPCPQLPHGGEHRGRLWLHPLQGHLWGADAHRPASTAWQVSACCYLGWYSSSSASSSASLNQL